MEKLLIITPHLSTGGAPQFTLNKIELLKDSYEIYCIEYNFLSPHYVVQRNKIIDLLGSKFYSLGDNKDDLLKIINKVKPNILSLEEFGETFIKEDILDKIYSNNRKYKILESTHSSKDNSNIKRWLPDKFIFASEWSQKMYSHFEVDSDVIEYPIGKKERNQKWAQEKLNLDTSYKHVLNIGLFTPGKNQGYAFDIAKKFKDEKIMFHFIGNQAPNFKDYWEPIMRNKPDNCIVWGERDDVDTFIQASDLFLFTSKFELNPLVIKEVLCYEDIPIMMFNLETYMGSYDSNKNINFISGDIVKDTGLIANKLPLNKLEKKVRCVHLLIDLNSEREFKSIESMSMIKERIEYIQNINERYQGDEWKKVTPLLGWANHGPGHYGAFNSFKSAIENHFTEELDAFMILEADCVLDIQTDEFLSLVNKAIEFCEKYDIEYFSFGDRFVNGFLNSPEIETYDDFKDFIVTNKIILAHCILFPQKTRENLLYSLKNKSWDSPDLWFNGVFNRMGIVKYPVAVQYAGLSMIDNEIKDFDYYSNKNREEVIPSILKNNNLNGIGVEIGVFKGQFSKHILENWNGTLYMVDPWRELDNYIDDSNHTNHPTAYLESMNSIKGYEDRAIMIRSLSNQAYKLFEDESLDFIYIDGNHSYESVKEDLNLWFPKLKKGGLFAGHDYLRMDWNNPPFAENGIDKHIWIWPSDNENEKKYAGIFGVNPAVDEFCKEKGIKINLTKEWTATWLFFK